MNVVGSQTLSISRKTTMNTISPNRNTTAAQQGFSLIELMIACFVLGIGVLSVTTMIGTSISRNLSSKNDTIAMAAAEQIMEELKAKNFTDAALAVGGSTLQADGRLLFANPSTGAAYATVNGYFRNITLANSDEAGHSATFQVQWNIASAFNNGSDRLKRITIGARRVPSNLRLQPVQLVFVKGQ
jgi:prepilin-type N-terminal cleavage/methylation domain-containing protein